MLTRIRCQILMSFCVHMVCEIQLLKWSDIEVQIRKKDDSAVAVMDTYTVDYQLDRWKQTSTKRNGCLMQGGSVVQERRTDGSFIHFRCWVSSTLYVIGKKQQLYLTFALLKSHQVTLRIVFNASCITLAKSGFGSWMVVWLVERGDLVSIPIENSFLEFALRPKKIQGEVIHTLELCRLDCDMVINVADDKNGLIRLWLHSTGAILTFSSYPVERGLKMLTPICLLMSVRFKLAFEVNWGIFLCTMMGGQGFEGVCPWWEQFELTVLRSGGRGLVLGLESGLYVFTVPW